MLWRKQEWAGRDRISVYTGGFRRRICTEQPLQVQGNINAKALGRGTSVYKGTVRRLLLLEWTRGAKR